ncbi:hypothetical protein PAXRUDRAFT_155776 [Paxillus rubicundulus Ve08.2h10]|uniref:DUF1168-domain-containing protein n=1 Tax=Paxillus rubicundulus Ve08.2h10 TaxID=930991 RepID=A0A0D0DQF9_9AGAM|nr:hypothetical protein PAXRUDRAFT_155776 [Paxillus rubicundulus Ve08.2h10]
MSTSNSPAPNSHSASPAPGPATRHALTPLERQRSQLERLLKDPSKLAYVPVAPKEKTIRPAREMMKNVQGSSAGAGSGEFHVYKASRRREYERLKLMEEQSKKEAETSEYERKRKEAEDLAEAKTAKNRAKRQKKKDRAKVKPSEKAGADESREQGGTSEAPLKRRRLVNGKELVFRKQGEESDEEEDREPPLEEFRLADDKESGLRITAEEVARIATGRRITFHEDD